MQEHRREVLREASIALQGRAVTLWEVSSRAEVIPVMTTAPTSKSGDTRLDLDSTLHHWGAPIIQGSRWVGCRLDDAGPWCVAPVRRQPAAPPPDGVERRSRERITLELAGLCLGLVDQPPVVSRPRLTEPDALAELVRQPSVIAHEVANPLTAALASLDLSLDLIRTAESLAPSFRAELLSELAGVGEGMDQAIQLIRSILNRAQKLDGLVHAFPHARKLAEQLRSEGRRQRFGRSNQIEGQIEAGQRRRQGIGDLVGNHAGLADQLSQGVRLRQARPADHRGLVHEAQTETRQLEGDPLPAAALHAVRRRGCRLPPHGGYAPGPRIVQPAADPATALDDRGTPAMQRTIEVEACVRGLGTRGAGHDRGHLRARRNLPQGDRSPLEGHARCAQDLATVLLHPMS